MPKTLSTQWPILLTLLTNYTDCCTETPLQLFRSDVVMRHSKGLCIDCPYCEQSETKEGEQCPHITIHRPKHTVWAAKRKQVTLASAFCNKSTLSALYELNPAAWIQCHSKHTLIPQCWRKYTCRSVLGSLHKGQEFKTLATPFTVSSAHCVITVFSPEGF